MAFAITRRPRRDRIPAPERARGQPFAILICSAAYFYFLGTATPYFPLWLASKGLSAPWIAEIAAFLAIGATIGQAALPYAALRIGRGTALFVASICALASMAALLFVSAPALLLSLSLAGAVFTGAAIPLIDDIALEVASHRYGYIRAIGSAAFAIATVGGGWLIERLGVGITLLLEILSLSCLVVASVFVRSADAIGAQLFSRVGVPDLRSLQSGRLWLLILSVAAINAGHAYYYTFANLHWSRDLGYPSDLIGVLWGTGVIFEIWMFSRFGDRGDARSALTLILAGAIGGTIRWGVSAFDPPLALLFALQALHGLSFAATILGGLRMVRLAVPGRAAPFAIGLFAAMVHGVVIGIATALLATRLGQTAEAGFLFMAALCAAGGIGIIMLGLTKKPYHAI